MPARREASCGDCWGAQLQRTSTDRCTPGHIVGARHFKTKFCAECKATMIVSSARVRALSDELAEVFVNNRSGGLWTKASFAYREEVRYRVVNNTNGCLLPVLIIFEQEAPHWFESIEMPKHLQSDDGYMRMCVSKGTLVPMQHMRMQYYKKQRTEEPPLPLPLPLPPRPLPSLPLPPLPLPPPPPPPPSASPPPAALQAAAASPQLCEVLVPSCLMTLAHKPSTSESSEEQSPSCDSDEPTFSTYEEKRMHRNRLSAAKSRRMKREHISNLERQVLELSQTVDELRREKSYWQSLEAVDPEEALRIELGQFISEPTF